LQPGSRFTMNSIHSQSVQHLYPSEFAERKATDDENPSRFKMVERFDEKSEWIAKKARQQTEKDVEMLLNRLNLLKKEE